MDHSPGDTCLVDCATTQIILHDKKYFSDLTLVPFNDQTISGPVDLIKGSRRATIVLPNGIILINLIEIYLFSRIFTEIDITFKL